MFLNSRWHILALILALMLAVPAAYGATQNAVLYGTVYDAAGNPAAGVNVTLENGAIGFNRSTVTGSDGSYNFAEVPPAENYNLSASRGSAKIDARSGIVVNVGDETVILPPLKEQPAVVATPTNPNPTPAPAAAPVHKQAVKNEIVSTAISGVINGDQLRSLPVAVNRNFLNAGLIPANTHDVEQGSPLMGASFSVAGNRAASNSFLLDGVDNVASSSNQAVPFQVNDAVQEFRITSSTANAEYGRNDGGTVNIVTRRGGNSFHGSVFGYFNNDALNANSPLSVYNGTTFHSAAAYAGPVGSTAVGFLPQTYNDYVSMSNALGFCTDSIVNSAVPMAGLHPCVRTGGQGKNTFFDPNAILQSNDSHNIPFDSKQFGANLGGPIIKDKWFFFGSYEGTRIDNPNPIFERVPSAFDETYNPFGVAGFRFSATDPNYVMDQKILSLYPKPNVVGVPGVLEFFRGQAPNYTNVNNYLARTDFKLSENTDLSARYVIQQLNQLHDDTLPKQSDYPGNGIVRDALNQNLDMTYSHSFSPSIITQASLGFNRFRVNENPQDSSFNAGTLGFPSSQMPAILLSGLDPQYGGGHPGINGSFAGWSDLIFSGLRTIGVLPTLDGRFPFDRLGAPLGAPLDRRDTTFFLTDNTSVSHGKHTFKFGGELRYIDNDVTDDSFSRGFMYSSDIGEFTSDSATCNELCLVFGGNYNAFTRPSFDFFQQASSLYKARLHSYGLAFFLQDSWRVHPRVTINYGLRYEYFSPPEDDHHALYNFDPIGNGLVQEDGFGTVDPYGNPCSPTTGNYPSVPQAVGPTFPPGNGLWNCQNAHDHFNKIIAADMNNFSPRIGIAWDAFGNGRTVVRAGVGWFYDQLPSNYMSQLMYNRPTTQPNALFGTILQGVNTNFCPLGSSSGTCGVGSTIVNPAVQASIFDSSGNNGAFYSAAPMPFAIYARDTDHSSTPYSQQVSATVQQQINNNLTVEVGYIGSTAYNLPVLNNSNFANEANLVYNGVAGLVSMFPVFTLTNQAASSYNSLLVRTRMADWHGLRMNATYTYSKSLDNDSNAIFPPLPVTMANLAVGYQIFGQNNLIGRCLFLGAACSLSTPNGVEQVPLTLPLINFSPGAVTTTGAGQILTSPYSIPQNPFNFLKDEYGPSDFNQKHRVVLDFTWEVPSLNKNFGVPRWLDNWMLSGVLTAAAGQPFTIFSGPIAGEVTQRANIIGPVKVTDDPNGAIDTSGLQLASQGPECSQFFFNPPPPGQPGFIGNFLQPLPNVACTGNSARNAFVGPTYVNMNFAIQKGFQVFGEGRELSFRTEFYNLFDRANYFNPISAYSLDGQTVNPQFGKILSAHEPRQIQFAVRFNW